MTEKQLIAAQWLNSAYLLSQKIEALKEEKRKIETDFKALAYSYTPNKKQMHERLDNLNAQLATETEALDQKWLEVKSVIENVPQKHYALLSYRYLSMLSWQTVEDMLYISTSTRKRQHRAALDSVSAVLNLSDPLADS